MSGRRRATVVIRQRDPETEYEDGYAREWCHRVDLEIDEWGVTLHYDRDQQEIYVPWLSVVRIDTEPCNCFDCQRIAA